VMIASVIMNVGQVSLMVIVTYIISSKNDWRTHWVLKKHDNSFPTSFFFHNQYIFKMAVNIELLKNSLFP
jgi:hypothetical protein